MGGIVYLDAGIFEKLHKIFGLLYKNTSQKSGTVMLETEGQARKNYVDISRSSDTPQKWITNANCIKALNNNRAVLIGSEMPVTITQLQINRIMREKTEKLVLKTRLHLGTFGICTKQYKQIKWLLPSNFRTTLRLAHLFSRAMFLEINFWIVSSACNTSYAVSSW